MKIKLSFVTNSSSSCFTIPRKILTPEQEFAIIYHAKMLHLIMEGKDFYDQPWDVYEKEDEIEVSTSMDNFDMHYYLEKIGVDLNKCKFEHG